MSARIVIERAGPGLTLQDLGRPGLLSSGLSRGGAADRSAIYEAAALLGGGTPGLAVEMAGIGGRFRVEGRSVVVAFTGAPMRASLAGGRVARWHATHRIEPGEVFEIGAVEAGSYGYLSVAGGIEAPEFLGARSAHLNAGIGSRLGEGTVLHIGEGRGVPGLVIDAPDRFDGGELRVLESPQFELFTDETRARFASDRLIRSARGNRMGVELAGGSYPAEGGLSVVSEMTVPGDIQMTGVGAPYILGPECQTTGGYPRIATVIPSDLDRAMQAQTGAQFTIRFVGRGEALAALRSEVAARSALAPRPLVRNPHDIADLLAYQLVSGVYHGDEDT